MEEKIKEPEDKVLELSKQIEELKKSVSTSVIPLPIAIVMAGVLVAGSVIYASVNYKNSLTASITNPSLEAGDTTVKNTNVAPPATSEDHILGNKDAPIKIVEYSDLECPFCKMFHQTMLRVMETYGKNGQVAWVYRHFPLDQLHPKARNEAIATECAAEQGGNDTFWQFTNKLFEITPSNNSLDPAELPRIAEIVGLDKSKFVTCLTSKRYDARIVQNQKDGVSSGAEGTPYSILFTPKGKKIVINGAQPYESVKALIDQALAE